MSRQEGNWKSWTTKKGKDHQKRIQTTSSGLLSMENGNLPWIWQPELVHDRQIIFMSLNCLPCYNSKRLQWLKASTGKEGQL